MAQSIRVAIIEDQPDVRDGLALLIGTSEGFECTNSFGSMEGALKEISGNLPDIVLVDIGLPGMSGIIGIERLRQLHPPLHCLILSVFDDDKRIFQAMCAGACGYLLK